MKMNLLTLLAVITACIAIPCNAESTLRGNSAQTDKSVACIFPKYPPRSNEDGVACIFPKYPPRSNEDGVACIFPKYPPRSNADGVAC